MEDEEYLMELYNKYYQEELNANWDFYPYNELKFVWVKSGDKLVVKLEKKE